jgi:predicted restriction endonuclease
MDATRQTIPRRVQRFFRAAVLSSYGQRCALSGRADPRNGLALHALYDRAFDRGYITFDENLRVVLSPLLQIENPPPLHTATLLALEGRPLTLPDRFPPDRKALAWHREVVFRRGNP